MKNINKLRLLLLLSSCLAITLSCSRNNDGDMNEKGTRREVLSGQQGIEKDGSSLDSESENSYVMRLEDTSLTLYEISGSVETAITTINIDPSYYPTEDIEELNRGVIAYSKEDGYARMENYTN